MSTATWPWIVPIVFVLLHWVQARAYLRREVSGWLFVCTWGYFALFTAIDYVWLSDKVFKGRRAPVSILYLLLTLICVMVYWRNPVGHPNIDIAMLIGIGFFIYGPVMLIGVHALDLAPKKAAGTAAGFTGLFGYVGGAVAANIVIGIVVDAAGWDAGFELIAAACVLAMILISFTWKAEKQTRHH